MFVTRKFWYEIVLFSYKRGFDQDAIYVRLLERVLMSDICAFQHLADLLKPPFGSRKEVLLIWASSETVKTFGVKPD